MKVVIAGSSDSADERLVRRALIEAKKQGIRATEVVCGSARGVESIGETLAEQYHIPVTYFPAEWEKYGQTAGFLRNRQMARYADALVAITDGSRETAQMIRVMKFLKKPVYIKQR
jgi:YspA, cpYpsA-related SLOG family